MVHVLNIHKNYHWLHTLNEGSSNTAAAANLKNNQANLQNNQS